MIAISNKQQAAILRLLDYLGGTAAGSDARAANARRVARILARQLRAKQPAKSGGEVMYFIGGLEG